MPDRRNTDESSSDQSPKPVCVALFGVKLGLALHGFVAAMIVLTMLPLLFIVTPGSGIRLMGQSALIFLAGAIGLFLGVPVSVAGMLIRRGQQGRLGNLGVVLNLIIVPVGIAATLLVAWAMNLKLES